jgi:hypothetical protein
MVEDCFGYNRPRIPLRALDDIEGWNWRRDTSLVKCVDDTILK